VPKTGPLAAFDAEFSTALPAELEPDLHACARLAAAYADDGDVPVPLTWADASFTNH
jgi:hypothetical protein